MLERRQIARVVDTALDEDAPHGDLTGEVFVPGDAFATADLVAREPGVLAGAHVFEVAMTAIDPAVQVTLHAADGDRFEPGTVLATVRGNARAVLRCERIALNLVQRMCGIATLTATYVEAAGPRIRVTDTRKTTPGLRALERHAVRCGGGHNHRFSLSEAVMAKDNHLALVDDITAAIRAARARLPFGQDDEDAARVGERPAVVAGRALVEASGSVSLETIGAIAETGVDLVSVGALTHAARTLDLGLDVRLS